MWWIKHPSGVFILAYKDLKTRIIKFDRGPFTIKTSDGYLFTIKHITNEFDYIRKIVQREYALIISEIDDLDTTTAAQKRTWVNIENNSSIYFNLNFDS